MGRYLVYAGLDYRIMAEEVHFGRNDGSKTAEMHFPGMGCSTNETLLLVVADGDGV